MNWATHVDRRPAARSNPRSAPRARAGLAIEMWPDTRGGKNWPHAAFNPETGLIYPPIRSIGAAYRPPSTTKLPSGGPALSSRSSRTLLLCRSTPATPIGHVDASSHGPAKSVAFAAVRWPASDRRCSPTAGGLLVHRAGDGDVIAIDADTGKTVWSVLNRIGRQRPADHLHADGKKYVTVLRHRRVVVEPRPRSARLVPLGGSVWTFALFD